ncbi:PRD domain-containing protein [Holdemania massiliensis]|uniref:PRD domain-containing protein n=1 Tax=Holdemania massiliensis TaxID=1468449 RepID=UPI001F0566EE|nr:PRD domain-containing protein [Holdemania massiliensis]
MVIVKLLNSSVVLAQEQDKEYILFGRGLGYNHKKGDIVDPSQIERVFVPQNCTQISDYAEMLEKADIRIIEIAGQITELAQAQLSCELSPYLSIALIDHLQFAWERMQKGVRLQNKLVFEVQRIYPEEFAVGQQGRLLMNAAFNQEFPIDEAGNIAFHIVNARDKEQDPSSSYLIVEMIKDILNICKYHFHREIDFNSLDYSRLIIHLEFFAKRVLRKELLENSDLSMLGMIRQRCSQEYQCAEKIKKYVASSYGQELSEEEMLYLTVHLNRVLRLR